MTPKRRSGQRPEEAKFVFQGTVKKLKAATLKGVPVSDRTVVVRVDRVIHAAEALSDYAGRDITVLLAVGERVEPGQTLIFYTNGWVFGESVAVQSIGYHEATTPAVAALSSHPDEPVRSLQTREALTQADRADLIVTGRVAAVRLPAGEARARAKAVASGHTSERISEHTPLWQEAVIDVDEVHKGSRAKKQVVVRFPSSTDVRWYQAPKFQAGQEGVFLLHKQQVGGARAKAMAAPLRAEEYTALHPGDFQPLDQLPQIRLAAGPKSTRRTAPRAPRAKARRPPRRRR
jgi:hypothetical protein